MMNGSTEKNHLRSPKLEAAGWKVNIPAGNNTTAAEKVATQASKGENTPKLPSFGGGEGDSRPREKMQGF